MRLRLAQKRDITELVRLHLSAVKKFPVHIQVSLGKSYLIEYYKVLFDEKDSVVVCAENDLGNVVGFFSTSLDYHGSHIQSLLKNRIRFFFSSLPHLIKNPLLAKKIYEHQRKIAEGEKIINEKVPEVHSLFWCWDENDKTPSGAIVLLCSSLSILKALGSKEVFCDVYETNKKVLRIHQIMGAVIVDKIAAVNNDFRYLIKYDLNKWGIK